MSDLIKPPSAAEPAPTIEGTICPFGGTAVAIPQQGRFGGLEVSVQVIHPPCRTDCKFFDKDKQDCTLLLLAKKLLS